MDNSPLNVRTGVAVRFGRWALTATRLVTMVVIRENDARLRYLLRRGGTDAGFAIVSVGAGKDSWLASVPRAPR
jgi:hypothetical protein